MALPVIETDVVVIGAGPVGLFSIFECGMNKLQCHVIDGLDMIGGQCAALYPEKPIYDIPAHPSITGAELIEKLSAQAAPFHPTYHLGQKVVGLHSLEKQAPSDFAYALETTNGQKFKARAVIIAAGVGAFGPNRPPLENLEQYESKSVRYYVKSRAEYANKKIVIAGGGDSAVDWAISLSEIASKIYVVHRRPKFRAAPESEDQLFKLAEAGKIELVIPYQLSSLQGQDGILSAVEVETMEGDKKTLEADILLPFFGLSMNLGPLLEWGLGFDKKNIAVDQSTSATNMPGVFAIGDVSTYPGKQKLILCGFAEAAQASHAIRRMLFPDEVIHFEYSTTVGVPSKASA